MTEVMFKSCVIAIVLPFKLERISSLKTKTKTITIANYSKKNITRGQQEIAINTRG